VDDARGTKRRQILQFDDSGHWNPPRQRLKQWLCQTATRGFCSVFSKRRQRARSDGGAARQPAHTTGAVMTRTAVRIGVAPRRVDCPEIEATCPCPIVRCFYLPQSVT
jgi:hypothetical protein